MAVQRCVDDIAAEMAHVADRQIHRMEVELEGYPHGTLAEVTAVRISPAKYRVVVREIDGRPMGDVLLEVEGGLEPRLEVDDGSIEGRNGARWYPVDGERYQREILEIDAKNEEVWHWVDTDQNPFVLECSCGRRRFARRTAIHQVDRCRVCARPRRLAYQNSWQRRNRKKSKYTSS